MKKYTVMFLISLVSFGLGLSVPKGDVVRKPVISRAEAEAKASWKIINLMDQVEEQEKCNMTREIRNSIFAGLLDRSIAEVERTHEVIDE